MMQETIAQMAPLVGALLAAGVVAGIVAGLFGVGGGVVIVPALALVLSALGFEGTGMHVAVGTSLATIVFTSIRSLLAHNRRGAVDWRVLRDWSPWIAVGALGGAWLANQVSGDHLTLVFGCVALVLSLQFLLGDPSWKLASDLPSGPLRIGVSTSVGALSAIMGIGGGTFGVTLMTVCGRPMHQAVGTSAAFGAVIGLPGALGFVAGGLGQSGLPPLSVGYVNLPALLIISLATLVTASIGAKLAHLMDGALLRRAFGVLLIVTALNMLRGVFLS